MEARLVFLLGLLAVSQVSAAPKSVEDGTAEINDYVDHFIKLLQPFMIQHNLDPLRVQNISEEFGFDFIIHYSGHIELNNGWLDDLSTIYRAGDCILKYDHDLLTITLDLAVDDVAGFFDYVGKFLGVGPSGFAEVSIKQLQVKVSLLVDLEQIVFYLQDFELINNGPIDMHLSGLGITGPILNPLMEAIVNLFETRIITSIGEQIRTMIENILSQIPPLLPPPPTTTTSSTEEPTTPPPTEEPTTPPPTEEPTEEPTTQPPTEEPTEEPTTPPPTEEPTEEPTTPPPTEEPTEEPTTPPPTEEPTEEPTTQPPTEEPTEEPTTQPPTEEPTEEPTTLTTESTTTEEPTEESKTPGTEGTTTQPSMVPVRPKWRFLTHITDTESWTLKIRG